MSANALGEKIINNSVAGAVLVVGGAGYIGSHMVKQLQNDGRRVVVLDDLSKGHRDAIPSDVAFVHGCLGDKQLVGKVIREYGVTTVMHFAAFIEVGESVAEPARYYHNNVVKTLSLLEAMQAEGCDQFIFSSTAAVFGEPQYVPIDEAHPKQPINPYGQTKLFIERVLADYSVAYGLKYVVLRYFNAAGAHPDGSLGERHDPETHLLPLILQAADGRRSHISVFGDDYNTADGSCVRDFVHVCDLCAAHALAINYLECGGESTSFNLGNGDGQSVKAAIASAEVVTARKIDVQLAARRPGDPAVLVADSTKAKKVLGWQPRYPELETIIQHAWQWESCHAAQQLEEKVT